MAQPEQVSFYDGAWVLLRVAPETFSLGHLHCGSDGHPGAWKAGKAECTYCGTRIPKDIDSVLAMLTKPRCCA